MYLDDFAAKRLKLESIQSGQYRIVLPFLHAKEAMKERKDLLRRLLDQFSENCLWVSDWDCESDAHWEYSASSEILVKISKLDKGGWLLLCSRDPIPQPRPLTTFPKRASDFMSFVAQTGAQGGVLSWLDDNEWIVVV